MLNNDYIKLYKEQASNKQIPKNGSRKIFHEKMFTDKMVGQPINRLDEAQLKDIIKVKNYGDIQKINEIKNQVYNLQCSSSKKVNNNLRFSRASPLKNSQSEHELSPQREKNKGKKIFLNHENISLRNNGPLREMPFVSSKKILSASRQNIPMTNISDFLRSPSKESNKQLHFSPIKNSFPSIEKNSGKKRFDENQGPCESTLVHLFNKTSETGFIPDVPAKQHLYIDTFNETFNNLFYTGPILSQTSRSAKYHSAEKYTFRNIINGDNIPLPKTKGVQIVDKQMYKFKKGTSLDNLEYRSSQMNKSTNQRSQNIISGYFPIREEQKLNKSGSETNKTLDLTKAQELIKTEPTTMLSLKKIQNKSNIFFLQETKQFTESAKEDKKIPSQKSKNISELYNSEKVRFCIHQDMNKNKSIDAPKVRSVSRNPINNMSEQIQALFLQPDILASQPRPTQDFIKRILEVNKEKPNKKQISKERNQSCLQSILKNETMGTPKRFLLSESSNKIPGRDENNPLIRQYNSTKASKSQSFYF